MSTAGSSVRAIAASMAAVQSSRSGFVQEAGVMRVALGSQSDSQLDCQWLWSEPSRPGTMMNRTQSSLGDSGELSS
jgi:hypothetical protein